MTAQLTFLIVINLFTFYAFYADKQKAKRGSWRVPEFNLLALCLIGGSVGGLASMICFRHKINNPLFRYGVPIILISEVVLLWTY